MTVSINPDRETENRGWILDPTGHRALDMGYGPPEKVDTPFGKATVIHMGYPDDASEWICDLCNEPILTVWGDEPFPVPTYGSYALCHVDYYKLQLGPATNRHTGEDLTDPSTGAIVPEGPWPLRMCRCPACYVTAIEWRQFIEPALLSIKADIVRAN